MNDTAAGSASSVGGSTSTMNPSRHTGNKSINSNVNGTHKTTLWSYILPLPNSEAPSSSNNNKTKEPPLPTTSPSDRNAVSIRLALGDAQASVQHLSDRVDKVLDQQRQDAKKLESLIGGAVQSVDRAVTAVAESNVAHMLKLEEALARCARLEESVAGLSMEMVRLGATCDSILSEATSTRTHDNVMALLPAIPMLQALPNSIENAQFKTTQALEHVSRDAHALLAAETKSWMNEHSKDTSASLDKLKEQVGRELEVHREAWVGALSLHRQEMSVMFSAVLAGIHSKDTSASLDKLKEQVGRELEVHREAWVGALSLHRQEMSVMFSAVLAGIKSVSGCSTATASGQTLIAVDNNTLAKTGQARRSGTSQSTPAPAPAPASAPPAQNTTHTVDITHQQPHGPSSSSGFVTARSCSDEEPQAQHAAKNPSPSSRNIQPGPVHGKNSTQPEGRVLVEDTQSTALSSLPDEDLPEQESMTFAGRGFGTLNKRGGSAFASFTNIGSPGFTVQRRPFVQGPNLTQTLKLAPNLTKEPGEPNSSAQQSGTPAPTLGRSSPSENAPNVLLTLKKRRAGVEDTPSGSTKRSRKAKTRVLMDSQELLMLDSSPER
ncbi:unnamed protein product [Rhizoctonia solani]|uniref:Uncharacterized protein n=1 Tax=Rhizoctonia solani TaxID=456999 RepID=A0A8H3BLL4_9AGAM|nr:unnamed protein product [Rhizoctonia solani]